MTLKTCELNRRVAFSTDRRRKGLPLSKYYLSRHACNKEHAANL